jgi:hypothetical protein
MRRPVNYARAIATIERATAEATNARSRHEVQGEIDATGIVVQSLGMPRERPTGRHRKLAGQHKKLSAETGLDKKSIETSEGNEFGSVSLARTRRANGISYERSRSTMGRPAGLELAIRRKLPSMFRSRRNLINTSTMPRQWSADPSITSRTSNP